MAPKKAKTPAFKNANIPTFQKTTPIPDTQLYLPATDLLQFQNIGSATATATMYSPPTNIYGMPSGMSEKASIAAAKKFVKPMPSVDGKGRSAGSSSSSSGSGTPDVKVTPSKGPFYYNAPMVSSAYFNPLSMPKAAEYVEEKIPHPYDSGSWTTRKLVKTGTEGMFHFVDQGAYSDAIKAWTITQDGNIAGGRGTLQMDRVTNSVNVLAQATQAAKKDKRKFDGNMYGFKFMYNPKEINMSWQGVALANPMYEALGLDHTAPITANMTGATVSFDLFLNRTEDMQVLRPDGTYDGSSPYPKWTPPPGSSERAELKKIVEMGTMYDMEYLFKALHGYAGNSNYVSSLRGETSDPGWLPVRPVELHLGNNLRYRVRVTGLSIRHTIFNSRMVPVQTFVSLTCNRYWDGIITAKGAATTGGGNLAVYQQ
jgi:hypothetical protein